MIIFRPLYIYMYYELSLHVQCTIFDLQNRVISIGTCISLQKMFVKLYDACMLSVLKFEILPLNFEYRIKYYMESQ